MRHSGKEVQPQQMEPGNLDLVLHYAMAAAAQEDSFSDRELGPIHLLKYAYLADLAYAARHDGRTFTGVDWTFHNFGPWSAAAFRRIDAAAAAIGAVRRTIPSRYRDEDTVRYRVPREDLDEIERSKRLPLDVMDAIRATVHTYRNDTPELLHHVYQTAPMVCAAPGDRLDFTRALSPAAPQPTMGDETGVTPSKNKLKAFRKRAQEILGRGTIQERIVIAPPRYDQVFEEGARWFDSLAGDAVPEGDVSLSVSDDVWKSGSRERHE